MTHRVGCAKASYIRTADCMDNNLFTLPIGGNLSFSFFSCGTESWSLIFAGIRKASNVFAARKWYGVDMRDFEWTLEYVTHD